MKKKWKQVGVSLSVLLTLFMVSRLMFDNKAYAQELPPIGVTYATDSSLKGFQGVYSKYDQLTTSTLSFDVGSGNKITKVAFMRDGQEVADIPEAVGKQSWSGTQILNGDGHDVISTENTTAKGYYAWYRYMPTDPHGVRWYEGGGSCPASPSDIYSVETENVNGYDMPKYPGCTDNELTLPGDRVKDYYFTNDLNTAIPSYVVGSPVSLTINKDLKTQVNGTGGVAPGKMDDASTTIDVSRSNQDSNADRFTVHYSQSFDFIGNYVNLAAPGAKLMLYYAAFSVDVAAKTYKYPDQLIVSYTASSTPSPSGPTSTPTPTPTPTGGKPTGDFDIVPSTIQYRDPFQLMPKDLKIPNGCTYQSHVFKLSKGGLNWTSSRQTNFGNSLSFSYPDKYPAPISAGTVTVSMQITASCGVSDWVTHTMTVLSGPNNPPYFKLGWFKEGDWTSKKPLDQIVQGTKLMVRVIDDPDSKPPSPSDPEGDPFSLTGWDYESGSNFVKSLPGTYGFDPRADYLNGIVMDTLGYQRIGATMTDNQGASYSAYTMVEVIPPNPIAACKLNPDNVKSRRPYPDTAFDGKASYSPIGRPIVEYIWGNKKSSYINDMLQPTTEAITLNVKDDAGLQSLQPATCNLTVNPDLPPVAALQVPPLGIRGQAVDLFNKSYSPDGDVIVGTEYRYKYDGNNNGFADDPWQSISGTMTKLTFNPSRVGKYLFDVKVTEDYGKTDDLSDVAESQRTLDVINLAPAVSFQVEGKNEQPEFNPPIQYNADTILNTWSLFQTNSTSSMFKNPWYNENGKVAVGEGKEEESLKGRYFQYSDNNFSVTEYTMNPPQNFGFGNTGLTAYRSIKDVPDQSKIQPLMVPNKKYKEGSSDPAEVSQYTPVTFNGNPFSNSPADYAKRINLNSNSKYIYFDYLENFYAMNKSKISKWTVETPTFNCENQYGCTVPGTNKKLEANPYDFVIEKPNPSYKIINGYYYGIPEYNPVKYMAGSKTLYQIVDWYREWKDSNDNTQTDDKFEVITYDLFTGAKLASKMYDRSQIRYNQWSSNTFDIQNDDLVVITSSGQFYPNPPPRFYQEYKYFGYRLNRNADLVQSNVIPSALDAVPARMVDIPYYSYQFSCGPVTSGTFHKGAKGEFYRFITDTCVDTDPNAYDYYWKMQRQQGVYLQKLNPDFTVAWTVRLPGNDFVYRNAIDSSSWNYYNYSVDDGELLIANPLKNEILVRTLNVQFTSASNYFSAVNVDSGSVSGFPYSFSPTGQSFRIDPSGNYIPGTNFYVTTSDGLITANNKVMDSSGNTINNVLDIQNLPTMLNFSTNGVGSNASYVVGTGYGMYVGDGLYAQFMDVGSGYSDIFGHSGGGKTNELAIYLYPGTPSDLPKTGALGKLGQFVSPFSVDNTEINITLTMDFPTADHELVGMSFRMQDPRNRYAAETDGQTLYLSKYVNGSRSVLASIPYPFHDGTAYSFKIKPSGGHLELDVNGVPYLSADDSAFASGKIGPFSDKTYVSFSNIFTKALPKQNTEWQTGYAIWDPSTSSATVQYSNVAFTDPENDPRAGSNQWSYTHTPKFLNNQGLSALNGQTVTSPQTVFDKVGDYMVTLRARDDPNPSYLYPSNVFESYRKNSNAYGMKVTVHRRPVAQFSLNVNGDGSVAWNDSSYDPDRWLSPTNYSAPDTPGMNYGIDRGITERKYYYIDPDGNYVERQLVRPPKVGTYEVGLMVKDEYGAWSYPATQTVSIGNVPPPNQIPGATLTYPTGSAASPTLVYTTKPTITWNQNDDDPGTIFTAYNVRIKDKYGNPAPGSGEQAQWTSSTAASWTLQSDLQRGETYQVQVQVKDNAGEWSEWSNIGWMVINSKPSVTITSPNGSVTAPTIINSDMRPTISWNQFDKERNYFARYYIEVLNESGQMVYNTGWGAYQNTTATSNSFEIPQDLPTGEKLQARMMVTDDDGNLWSDWSNTVWFVINFPPSVTITNPDGTFANPTIVSPTPLIEWWQSDPDPNTTFSKYQIQIWSADGTIEYLNMSPVVFNSTNNYGNFQVMSPLPQGKKLMVRMQVWDQYDASSGWSVTRWIFTNRPPVADFDWTPKPAFEGDDIQLIDKSSDPDGDALTYSWVISGPGGYTSTQTTKNASISGSATKYNPGLYTVSLTVRDPYGATDTVVKTITVQELTVKGQVKHTDEWNANRIAYNQKYSGTDDDPRPYSVFWAGERFVLIANTTDTQTATQATDVEVTMGNYSTTLTSSNSSNTLWSGELYSPDFDNLDDGPLTFTFTATWNNGVVKTDTVIVDISGKWTDYFREHRIK